MESTSNNSTGIHQWTPVFAKPSGHNVPSQIAVEAQSVITTTNIHRVPNYKDLSTVIYIWGENPADERPLSNATQNEPWTPTIYRQLSSVRISSVSCSSRYMMLLSSSHRLYALGHGEYGQLGLGSDVHHVKEPTMLRGIHTVTEVSCGENHCVALGTNGKIYSWGLSDLAGHEDGIAICLPKEVVIKPNPVRCRSISVNNNLTVCSCDAGSSLYHWGIGFDGVKIDKPQLLYSFDKMRIRKVSVGKRFALALSETGILFGWGDSTYGETMGWKDFLKGSYCMLPKRINYKDLRNIVNVQTGDRHALMIDSAGRLISMGENMYGQCGFAPSHHRAPYPVELPDLPFFTDKIFCGPRHSACINTGNQLYTWGHSSKHKLIFTTSVEMLVQQQRQPGVSLHSGVKNCCSQPQLIYSLLNEKVVCAGLADNYTVVVTGEGVIPPKRAEPTETT